MSHYPKLKTFQSYRVYTAFYIVDESILKIYQNTLGTISFSYDSPSNILKLNSSNLFGTTSNSTPDKFYGIASVVDYGGSNLFLRTELKNSSLIHITDGTPNPGQMLSGSLKFFLELKVYE